MENHLLSHYNKAMVLIIGDIISEFDENEEQFYEFQVGGSAVEIASYLEDEHIPFAIISSISMDKQGEVQKSLLSDLGWIKESDTLSSPLLSAVSIDQDLRLIGTAAAALDADKLYSIISEKDHSKIIISAPLLSVSPSSEAIAKSLSMLKRTKVFASLNADPTHVFSLEKIKESLGLIGKQHELFIMGEMVKIDGAKVIEQENLANYLR